MKKYTAYKTIQLVLLLVLAGIAIFRVFTDASVYHQVAVDPTSKLLAITAWAALGISFVFVLVDYYFFFGYIKEYREMEYAANSDPLSGIANRFSCDMMIEKYLDTPLNDSMGCMMLEFSNILEVNRLYGHAAGNTTIRDFSNILRLSSNDLCFVGRNGGNKFLALFENTDSEKMNLFLDRVNQRVAMHNRNDDNYEIQFNVGIAMSGEDDVHDIIKLVSLANSRMGNDSMPIIIPTAEGDAMAKKI